MATNTSPNMNIAVPVVLGEPGPAWAQDLYNALFTTLDQHNHQSGKGVPIVTAALNINADLTFNSNNALALRAVRFTQQASPLNLGSDLGELSNVLGDAYWNNASGTAIQLTKNGFVNSTFTSYVTKTNVTGTTTIQPTDTFQLYYVNASGGAVTINLPLSSSAGIGRMYVFTDYTQSANTHNITWTPNGTDKINNVNGNYVLATNGATTYFFSDGAGNWVASSVSLPNNAFTAPIVAPRRTITTTFTIDSSGADYILFCNHGAAFNLTLPTPTAGRVLIVEDITGAAETNNITLVRHAAENIDGVAASRVLQTNWGRWTIECDGTNWFLKGCGKITKKIFTANGTFVVPAGVTNVDLEGCGGGGAGGSSGTANGTTLSGGGGGGGALLMRQRVVVVPNASVTVTIGTGGTGPVGTLSSSGTNGPNGTDTTFGSLATFTGANGGQQGGTSGVVGTIGSGGGLAVRTGTAVQAWNMVSTFPGSGTELGIAQSPSMGGFSLVNAGGSGSGSNSPNGQAGGASGNTGGGGGGGGGAYGAGAAGGTTGTTGNPGSSAAANTGAGGGGGGAATVNTNTGGAGGNGGSGQLTVTWVD